MFIVATLVLHATNAAAAAVASASATSKHIFSERDVLMKCESFMQIMHIKWHNTVQHGAAYVKRMNIYLKSENDEARQAESERERECAVLSELTQHKSEEANEN